MAYNKIQTLPAHLAVPSEEDEANNSLETLILEGNPLSTPDYEYLSANCQLLTNFSQIITCLKKFYNLPLPKNVKDEIVFEKQHLNENSLATAPPDDDSDSIEVKYVCFSINGFHSTIDLIFCIRRIIDLSNMNGKR